VSIIIIEYNTERNDEGRRRRRRSGRRGKIKGSKRVEKKKQLIE